MSNWKERDRPEIASEWNIEEIENGTFLARSESGLQVLTGDVLTELLRRLDGHRNIQQLVRELPAGMHTKVHAALQLLEDAGVIARSRSTNMPRREAAWWRLIGADTAAVTERRPVAACRVISDSSEQSRVIEETLSSFGIPVKSDAGFRLVTSRDYLSDDLAAIHEECTSENAPWMLVRPHGRRQWIGPLFVPGKPGCWHCLAWWLTLNGWSAAPVIADVPALRLTTLRLAATEAAKWILSGTSETAEGQIWAFDTRTLSSASHRVRTRPECPYCGATSAGRVNLADTISPLTGVTARVEILKEWPGIAVCTGEGSQKVAVNGEGTGYYCRPPLLFGVAETCEEARTVCLAEGVERFSARYQGDGQIKHATWDELGTAAVRPEELLLPSGTLPGDSIAGWVEAERLTGGERRYLPAGFVYLGYDADRFEPDTTGCAAGLNLESATTAALLELIERDAVALWWYSRAARPPIDWEACRSQRIDAAMAAACRNGWRVWLLDLTTDFEVPVCVAVSAGSGLGIAVGCAAHPDPERCVWKALAGMTAVAARFEAPLSSQRHWLQDADLKDHPYMLGSGTPVRYGNAAETPGLRDLLDRVKAAGLDVLRVDLTRPELGVPVVRVVAPGLRPTGRLLAPGRLYDVPLRLGWVKEKLTAAELNPIPFVL